jgi:glycosyltransferase involved in cell wall biosynthesis
VFRLLYLRSVYWFNLKTGGSVGHTAGVVNSLNKKIKLDVYSNDKLPGVAAPVHIITPIKIPFLPNDICELLYSLKLIVRFRKLTYYNAIYQRYSGFSFASAYLSKRHKIPFILEFNSSTLWTLKHWKSPDGKLKRLFKNIYQFLFKIPIVSIIEPYNLKVATLIIVVSKVLKESLVSRGIPEHKILVNPNGIDPEKYYSAISGNSIRKKYNLDKKQVIGFIGTFGQWHGVVEMAQAIVRFFQQNPDAIATTKFLLIGDGVLMPQVKQIVKQSSYSKNIILTGSVAQEEGASYLAACDIFLSPHIPNPDGSKFFGSPTKLFEYMGMGKAIIASKLEQIGDILEHGKTAYLVPPGDVQALADAIAVVADDEMLQIKLGENARKEVVAKYTWDRHVERILEKIKICEK